jgi:hypothetical protein
MKAFKKLALVTAIAAAPFAQAEMTAIDDSLLGEMTGQAGISIELDTAITIDTFTYTDTDGAETGNAGNLVMSGIAFGGGTVGGSTALTHGDRLQDLVIEIDVDENEGVVIHLGGTDESASLGGLNPVDFGLHIDSVSASGVTANIASDINIAGNLGPIDVTINNQSGGDLIGVKAYFEVTSGNLDVDVIGLGISNLKIGQDSMPLLSGGDYQQDVRNAFYAQSVAANIAGGLSEADAQAASASLLTADANTLAALINGAAAAPSVVAAEAGITAGANAQIYQGNYDATIAGAVDPLNPTAAEITAAEDAGNAAVAADGGATATALIAADAGATAAGIEASANEQNATNMAFVAMTIGSGSANYSSLTEGDVVVNNALIVSLTDFNIDVSMDLSMGETAGVARSLGSIAIDNLNMSGTTLKIYGH